MRKSGNYQPPEPCQNGKDGQPTAQPMGKERPSSSKPCKIQKDEHSTAESLSSLSFSPKVWKPKAYKKFRACFPIKPHCKERRANPIPPPHPFHLLIYSTVIYPYALHLPK
jgi:hypothetical protein